MSIPCFLKEVLSDGVRLDADASGIYAVAAKGVPPGAYDRPGTAAIYDLVACNPFYNRLMWGYSVSRYAALCDAVLAASPGGRVLDLACGALAFTAGAYANRPAHRVVFLDQSVNLLKKAKRRLAKRLGSITESMVFLHADALDLPFEDGSFDAVICLNLLHCIEDAHRVLTGIKRALIPGGRAALTTLVESDRWSNAYLGMLARSGALIARSRAQLISAFETAAMPVTLEVHGHLAVLLHADRREDDHPRRPLSLLS